MTVMKLSRYRINDIGRVSYYLLFDFFLYFVGQERLGRLPFKAGDMLCPDVVRQFPVQIKWGVLQKAIMQHSLIDSRGLFFIGVILFAVVLE